MFSRFKIGDEITPIFTGNGLTYGKFYTVIGYKAGVAGVMDDDGVGHGITDGFGITREEYNKWKNL